MNVINLPWLVFLLAMLAFSLAVWSGSALQKSRHLLTAESREDLGVVIAATLTLLGLVIGFTFSMAISRYDLRKNYEEAEANAIGTEYARTDLMPEPVAGSARGHLREYVAERLRFYTAATAPQLRQVNAETERLQQSLWSDVRLAAQSRPDPITALAVAGMNDVLNSQGYTQAAWWNRIPIAAWSLMAVVGIICNMMVGFNTRDLHSRGFLRYLLPLVLSVAFLLIADIDSPRGGVIRVVPQNLMSLSDSLR